MLRFYAKEFIHVYNTFSRISIDSHNLKNNIVKFIILKFYYASNMRRIIHYISNIEIANV